MDLPFIGSADLERLVPMDRAIDSLAAMFLAASTHMPPRTHHVTDHGDLLLMPAWNDAVAGVKLATVAGANPDRGLPLVQGCYVLLSSHTLSPLAFFDGGALTALRTPAVSALATKYLARPDASHLVIFGSGTQAHGHLKAMMAVRDITSVTVVARSPGSAATLIEEAAHLGIETSQAGPEAVAEADIICTCTTSRTPLFDGTLVPPGTHVNAIGSFKPGTRELDTATVARSRLVVEGRAAALAEKGDILLALEEGAITERHIKADLPELLAGAEVRTSPEDITVFASVGVALEDLAVAAAAYEALGKPGSS